MRDTPRGRWITLFFTGSMFALLSGCPLPDRFFENTVRSVTATIADQLVANVILELTGIDIIDPGAADGG